MRSTWAWSTAGRRSWCANSPGAPPRYCIFVRFRGAHVQAIRDYRYATDVFAEAAWRTESST